MAAYLLVFTTALFVSLALTPVARRLSLRWGVVREPGGRRRHAHQMPLLGGLPLLAAYLVAAAIAIYFWLPPADTRDILYLPGVLLGSVVIFAGGILDDLYDLSYTWQFVIQVAATAVAMGHEIFIERFRNPFDPLDEIIIEPTLLIFMLTLIWIVSLINFVNWLDGLDGLATGVGTIALLFFAWHSFRLGLVTVPAFYLPLALAGASVGFLFFNFAPARIFLGTAGVFLLGYNLATLAILAPAKWSTALLVLAVPIIDGVWLVIDRIRHGQSPMKGDRRHLHFRLADSGLSTRSIVLGYYGVAVVFGSVAVMASSALTKVAILAGLGTAVLGLLIWLSFQADKEREKL
jgi:UDP-GlcNAc:undecaprenyl-phosphate GlcNAc-1-phosphate transferase